MGEFDEYEKTTLKLAGCDVPSYSRARRQKIFEDFVGSKENWMKEQATRKEAYEVIGSRFQVLPFLLTTGVNRIEKSGFKTVDDLFSRHQMGPPHGIKQITVGPPHGIKQITMFIRENVECLDLSFTTTTTIKVNNCTLIFHHRKL
ncbi:hypothetical protein J6590_090975 [Homalodisca vitripennis]|nr:hypothetical protein J6590_090975 [Homalodisca vitripennis]